MPVNSWRVMWLVALYDCPVKTPQQRKAYQQFHTLLLQENFVQHQFSVYVRHFPTLSTAEAEVRRIGGHVPSEAQLSCFFLTDKQYGMTREFFGSSPTRKKPSKPLQIELF
jgi:CRISPR-associated protein Cas2